VESVVYTPDVARALDAAAGDPRLRALASTPAWRDRWLPGRLRAIAEARDYIASLPLPAALQDGWKTPGLVALRPGPEQGGRPETLVVKQLDAAPLAAARAAAAMLGGRRDPRGASRIEYAPGKHLLYDHRGDLVVLSDSAAFLRAALEAGEGRGRWERLDAERRAFLLAATPGELGAALDGPSPGVDLLLVRLRLLEMDVEARVFGPGLTAVAADAGKLVDPEVKVAMDAVGAWTARWTSSPHGLVGEVAWR
jgi:hypothetical protein